MKDNVLVFLERYNQYFSFQSDNTIKDFEIICNSINYCDYIKVEDSIYIENYDRFYKVSNKEFKEFEKLREFEQYIFDNPMISIDTKIKMTSEVCASERYKDNIKRALLEEEKCFQKYQDEFLRNDRNY